MWFNRGSGGSPLRLTVLPHGFTPASLRCLCAMDKKSLRKALQDCLRALRTGQGADPPPALAPQAAAAPPAPHLADTFPLKEEVVVHNTCNPDTTLAPDTPEWRWLADVTPKYVFCRAMMLWMKKHRQEDKDGVQSYPWETECLSAGDFLEWKVLRVGLSSDPQGHMSLYEPGLDALFRNWATVGCGVARSASWFGADSMGRGGGHSAGHGPRFFFKALVELPPGLSDELEVQRYTATPSSMLAMGATISGGGKHKKAKASAATAAAAPTAMAPSPFVQPSVVQAIQGVQQVRSSSTLVSAGATMRLNRLYRLQPCTFEHHLPTH